MNFSSGMICGLTGDKAAFENSCRDFSSNVDQLGRILQQTPIIQEIEESLQREQAKTGYELENSSDHLDFLVRDPLLVRKRLLDGKVEVLEPFILQTAQTYMIIWLSVASALVLSLTTIFLVEEGRDFLLFGLGGSLVFVILFVLLLKYFMQPKVTFKIDGAGISLGKETIALWSDVLYVHYDLFLAGQDTEASDELKLVIDFVNGQRSELDITSWMEQGEAIGELVYAHMYLLWGNASLDWMGRKQGS